MSEPKFPGAGFEEVKPKKIDKKEPSISSITNFSEKTRDGESEKKETKKTRFQIKEMGYPGWELNDEMIRESAKSYLKEYEFVTGEIEVISWKKLGVEMKNGVKRWGIEVEYSDADKLQTKEDTREDLDSTLKKCKESIETDDEMGLGWKCAGIVEHSNGWELTYNRSWGGGLKEEKKFRVFHDGLITSQSNY